MYSNTRGVVSIATEEIQMSTPTARNTEMLGSNTRIHLQTKPEGDFPLENRKTSVGIAHKPYY